MEISNKDLASDINVESDIYFKSKQHRYIFALAELDGENRAKILEITIELYNDKDKARIWRDKIVKLIHPDVCTIEGSQKAMAKLNELYSRMVEDE